MSNLSQRYIAAMAELSQFHYVRGNKDTLTHILSGVQVAPENDDEAAEDTNYVHLTFVGGHQVDVDASHYLELMLSEDATHQIHAAGNGLGEIHELAKKNMVSIRKTISPDKLIIFKYKCLMNTSNLLNQSLLKGL